MPGLVGRIKTGAMSTEVSIKGNPMQLQIHALPGDEDNGR